MAKDKKKDEEFNEKIDSTDEIKEEEKKPKKTEEIVKKIESIIPEKENIPEKLAPEPVRKMLNLRHYARLTGLKFDQISGFVAWCKGKGYLAMPLQEWKAKFEEYKNTPML